MATTFAHALTLQQEKTLKKIKWQSRKEFPENTSNNSPTVTPVTLGAVLVFEMP